MDKYSSLWKSELRFCKERYGLIFLLYLFEEVSKYVDKGDLFVLVCSKRQLTATLHRGCSNFL